MISELKPVLREVPAPPDTPSHQSAALNDRPPVLPANSLHELLRTLWRRRWLMAGTVLAVMAVAVVSLGRITPRYTATAQIMVDPRQTNVLDIEQVLSGLPATAETIQSEIEVLTSRNLAARVVGAVNLAGYAEFAPPPAAHGDWRSWLGGSKTMPAANPENQIIERFLDHLKVRAAGRSRVIDISFTSTDPGLSAVVANSIADLYLTEQLEAKFDATRRATTWLSTRLDELRLKAEAAELAVARFKTAGQNAGTVVSLPAAAAADIAAAERTLEQARAKLDRLQALRSGPPPENQDAGLSPRLLLLATDLRNINRQSATSGEAANALRTYHAQLDYEITQQTAIVLESERQLSSLRVTVTPSGETAVDPDATAARLNTLEREAQATRTLYETVLARFKETSEQQGLEQPDARLISRAALPTRPAFPDPFLFLVISLFGATALALILAFAAEKMDSGFRSSDQIEAMLGLPTLAMIPSLRSLGVKNQQPETYVTAKPASSFAESIRMLRTSLLLGNIHQPPKVIALTSALPGEGKTSLALALAHLASCSGEKVVVVDADLRRPRVHQALGVENSVGLSDLLSGKAGIDQVLKVSLQNGRALHFITAGQNTPHATELLRSEQMKRFLRGLAANYTLVIVDGPPVLPVADARVLATLADSVLCVVRWRDTRREVAAQAVRQILSTGGNLAGIVLNNVDVRRHAEYSYSDSGYYYGRYRHYYAE